METTKLSIKKEWCRKFSAKRINVAFIQKNKNYVQQQNPQKVLIQFTLKICRNISPAVLKQSKNFSLSAVRHCPSSSAVRPPPSALRRPPNTSPDIEHVCPPPSALGY